MAKVSAKTLLEKPKLPRALWAVFLVVVLIILGGGRWIYQVQRAHLRKSAAEQLSAIAKLKIDEISGWHAAQLRDARVFMYRPFVTRDIVYWLASREDEAAQRILTQFEVMRRHYKYEDVALVAPDGEMLLSLSGRKKQLSTATLNFLNRAIENKEPVLADLCGCETESASHLYLIVPVIDEDSSPRPPLAAVIMAINASDFLFPLIQSWPVPSRSAETLLIRRDGRDVVFLNELRHRKGTALTLRAPITQESLPAAMAVLGKRGIVDGVDYRGVRVLAFVAPIPGLAWFMVSKVDYSEAFSPLYFRAVLISLFTAAMLGIAGLIMVIAWQRSRALYYQVAYEARAALKENEEYLAATLRSIGDAVITTDSAGKVKLLNDVAEKLTGWVTSEAQGQPLSNVFNIVNAFSKQQAEDPVSRVLSEGRVVGLANHTVLVSRTGREYQIADSAAPINSEGGDIVGVVLVFRDVTEQYRLQQELESSEENYRLIFQNANDAVFVHEISKERGPGRFVDVNEQACRMLGYTREELLELDVSAIDVPEQQERISEVMEALLTEGRAFFETEHLCKLGRRIPVEVSVRAIHVRGKPHVLSIVRDITERKRAASALAAERERLAVTLRSIGDAVISTDTEGRVVLMNKVAEEMTGWKLEEAEGEPLEKIFRIINERTREPCESPVMKVMASGLVISVSNNTLLISRDGREICIVDSGAPIKDPQSKTVGVVLVFRDITEKRRADENIQKAQRLSSLGVLAGGIAHDFNNLLGGILGYVDVARESAKSRGDEEVVRYLSHALTVFDRARNLTQQLLTFSRGGMPVKKIGDLGAVLREVVQFALSGSNLRAEYSIPEDLWPSSFDPNQIGQVIENIVINAKQAMPGGGVIEVSAENAAVSSGAGFALEPGEYVCFHIRDNGVGIPREFLPKIFDPFFTTKQAGHGLGLSTSYSIVKAHSGQITADSAPGKGSKLSVYLPAFPSARIEREDLGRELPQVRGRILIMDDEESLRQIASAMLTRVGHSVVIASSGAEALSIYERAWSEGTPFDLVILDLTVPGGIGGKDVLDKMLEIAPQVLAVASSGYSEDPIIARPQDYGFKASLRKPYKKSELEEVVAEVLLNLKD